MKKIFTLLFFLLSVIVFCQTKNISIYLECYSTGDTLNGKGITEGLSFNLQGEGAEKYVFKKWEIIVYFNNRTILNSGPASSHSRSFSNQIKLPDEVYRSWNKINKIEIQGIVIFFNGQEGNADVYLNPDGSISKNASKTSAPFIFYVNKNAFKKCGEKTVDTKPDTIMKLAITQVKVAKIVNYTGKLLMGKEKNKPVINQKIILRDKITKESQSTITNNYGDFTFKNIDANDSVEMNLDGNNTDIEDGELYMARPDGSIIRSFNRANNIFYFDFIPPELIILTKEKEEDTELKIKNFNNSDQSELTVVEDIYYPPNSFEIDAVATKKIYEIVNAMIQNKSLKLAITSHTDSKGDDAYNLTLSQKRAQKVMDYFILQGIEKARLVAKGVGETIILNRCKNGIDCSEMEHQLNRRTEFKFTK